MAKATGAARMGVDIGGTFTDTAVVDAQGKLHVGKTLTTPRREEQGVMGSIAASKMPLSEVDVLVHGTTLVINSLVERRGARVGLVTTGGFRDVYLMGQSNRPDSFNVFFRRDEPLVPRHRIYEINERVSASGEVVRPMPEAEIEQVIAQLRRDEIDAVAIAFLNSYAFTGHEEALAQRISEALPDIYVTTSSGVSQFWREYERFSTGVANAYVGPVIDRYISAIEGALTGDGFDGSFIVMDSNGGGLNVPAVKKFPVRLLESGPVGGVLGVRDLTRELGIDHAVTFDMGGTTAKGSLVEYGRFDSTELSWPVGYATGFPVQAPCVDIIEVGAGGGSIAWVDDSGRLRVGPRSAGAEPGPACYGNGGTELTVTDANVYCGRLQPDFFLGSIDIHPELAAGAVERLARQVDMDPMRLALGVLRLANLSMADVVRQQTVVKGRDPREHTLFGFGGAGPLHACEVAMEVGIPQVIIPTSPGHFSALGMLQADVSFDRAAVLNEPFEGFDFDKVNERLSDIGQELAEVLGVADASSGELVFEFSLALRYQGQEHTLRIPAERSDLKVEPGDLETLGQGFHSEHRLRYRHDHPDSPIEVVAAYVNARRPLPKVQIAKPEKGADRAPAKRPMRFTSGDCDASFVYRHGLDEGDTVTGPAVIYEEGSNIVVPPGAVATVIAGGHLSIDLTRAVA